MELLREDRLPTWLKLCPASSMPLYDVEVGGGVLDMGGRLVPDDELVAGGIVAGGSVGDGGCTKAGSGSGWAGMLRKHCRGWHKGGSQQNLHPGESQGGHRPAVE